MNTFKKGLQNSALGVTANGAPCYDTTYNSVLDMFAMGAAMRNREEDDIKKMFSTAYSEEELKALQCLFYIGDVRGGQGERRFFRTAYKHLIETNKEVAEKNLMLIPKYKRWDDLIYICLDTPLEDAMVKIIKEQLDTDMKSHGAVSLLAKWMPSENTSSEDTKLAARKMIINLEVTPKEYRKMLSKLRAKIKIVETLMSQNRWDEIEFDKLPSKAGFIYRNAFARNDIIGAKYQEFMDSKTTKVNANVLYPYEIVKEAFKGTSSSVCNKYWDNLPDYLHGNSANTLCVVDTSGSMSMNNGTPRNVALSLGLYFGERNKGPFKDYFITFSERPEFVKIKGKTISEKVIGMNQATWGMNTNIKAVFDLLLNVAKRPSTKEEDIPENILVISDMEFDTCGGHNYDSVFDTIKKEWTDAGLKMPHLVFWNVNSMQNNLPIIDDSTPISYVSGFSPTIFETIITGKKGIELMNEVLSKYTDVKI